MIAAFECVWKDGGGERALREHVEPRVRARREPTRTTTATQVLVGLAAGTRPHRRPLI